MVSHQSGHATSLYLTWNAVVPDQQNNSILISSVAFFYFIKFFFRDKWTARAVDVLSIVLSGAATFESINEKLRAIICQLK